MDFEKLKRECTAIINGKGEWRRKLDRLCEIMHENVPHYSWVGFYLVKDPSSNVLHLGPYRGEPTEHVKIPFGRGICGQAAKRKETVLVQDVRGERNYLACSPKVLSEIVVPILKEGRVVGEIDIDSHTLGAFGDDDREFLEWLSREVEKILP